MTIRRAAIAAFLLCALVACGKEAARPPSETTVSQSIRSQRWSTIHLAPQVPLDSSSALSMRITSRESRSPDRARSPITTAKTAASSLSSSAPRPQRKPSRISPDSGSTVHDARSTPTTSMCAMSSSGFFAPVPRIRATRLPRPGADSMISDATPHSASAAFTRRQTAVSFALAFPDPGAGGLMVSMRRRSPSSRTASSPAASRSSPPISRGAGAAQDVSSPSSAIAILFTRGLYRILPA